MSFALRMCSANTACNASLCCTRWMKEPFAVIDWWTLRGWTAILGLTSAVFKNDRPPWAAFANCDSPSDVHS